jgi:lipopolysaccharide export system permease protein
MVGKDLDLWTIGRLLFYLAVTLVPLALPLAVLLSSIMTLGNLGETFELVAIKSAGISLLRFGRPLLILACILTCIAFYFNISILPIANLKMNTQKYDVIVTKPAFDIKEGIFYDKIDGYVIKIGKKDKDDSTIHNVVIYEQNNNGLQDNIIVASKGKMIVTPDRQSLLFILQDGSTYQEKGERSSTNTEFVRMGFSEYKKVLDLSSFKVNKTNDSSFRNNFQMVRMQELSHRIDSIKKVADGYRRRIETTVEINNKFVSELDTTGWVKVEKAAKEAPVHSTYLKPESAVRDSLAKNWVLAAKARDSSNAAAARFAKSGKKPLPGQAAPVILPPLDKDPPPLVFSDLLPDSTRGAVLDRTIAIVNSTKISLDQPAMQFGNEANVLTQHEVAWHEKITTALACLVMFLIGAPLGSIIRKGGIGMPLVFAVIFFVIFFLLNNFGKKLANQAVLSPFAGMWMATYVLTPIGLFLIYKALHDSTLFNKEPYVRLWTRIRSLLPKRSRVEPF